MPLSESVTPEEMKREIMDIWGWYPYRINFGEIRYLDRRYAVLDCKCVNCNSVLPATLDNLYEYARQGYYCPECRANFNPNDIKMPDLENYVCPEKYKEIMLTDYTIMTEITERYGFNPYRFIGYCAGKHVRLEHNVCNTQFIATPEMLFENRKFENIHKNDGSFVTLPYCPKCDKELTQTGHNYGSTLFVELLDRWFEKHNVDFPYKFKPESLYIYTDSSQPLSVVCKYCDNEFIIDRADELFVRGPVKDNGSWSKCPYCAGLPKTGDSTIDDIEEKRAKQAAKIKEINKLQEEEQARKAAEEAALKAKEEEEMRKNNEHEKIKTNESVETIVEVKTTVESVEETLKNNAENTDMLYDENYEVNRAEPDFLNPTPIEDFEPDTHEEEKPLSVPEYGSDEDKKEFQDGLKVELGIIEPEDEQEYTDEKYTITQRYIDTYGFSPAELAEKCVEWAEYFNKLEEVGQSMPYEVAVALKNSTLPILSEENFNATPEEGGQCTIVFTQRLMLDPVDWEDYSDEELDNEITVICPIYPSVEESQSESKLDIINSHRGNSGTFKYTDIQ